MTTKVSQDNDVSVTYEDQQKINQFARINARLQDVKDEVTSRKRELQNYEDAESELLMLEDDSAMIPYQIGEVFVHCTAEDAGKRLAEVKDKIQGDIGHMEAKCKEYQQILSELKVQLYAKFGNNINLEADEEQ